MYAKSYWNPPNCGSQPPSRAAKRVPSGSGSALSTSLTVVLTTVFGEFRVESPSFHRGSGFGVLGFGGV